MGLTTELQNTGAKIAEVKTEVENTSTVAGNTNLSSVIDRNTGPKISEDVDDLQKHHHLDLLIIIELYTQHLKNAHSFQLHVELLSRETIC